MKFKLIFVTLILLLFFFNSGCQSTKTSDYLNPDVSINTTYLHSVVKSMTDIEPARNYENIESLNKAANLIKEAFTDNGYFPVEQIYTIGDREYKNIIASYGPDDAPRFIIGAHYDVYGNYPGADDNASGIAGLIELSRLFQAYKPKINYRIDFVAYTLEEPPFFRTEGMGSHVHAQWLHNNEIDIIGMVSLEMIGYFTDTPESQAYPIFLMKWFYPSNGNFIAVVGNYDSSNLIRHFKNSLELASIGVESLKAPSFLAGVDFSDHMNYWKFDHEAVMITDTSFYRNNNYHEASDTIDTLDFKKMAKVIKGVYWASINLKN